MPIRNVLVLFFCFTIIARGQGIIDTVPILYNSDRLDELNDLLPDLVRDHPGHPTVLFLQGLFETNAETALTYYDRVYTEYSDSEFADDALFRVAQYHYTVGNYDAARHAFATFLDVFRNSPLTDRVQYMFCNTVYAQGKIDSARVLLKVFVRNVRSSPFVDLAINDLENEALWQSLKPVQPAPKVSVSTSKIPAPLPDAPEYKYSLQIGAFSIQRNAQRVYEKFQADHFVEIRPKNVGGKTYYAVWIGLFTNRDEAKDYAAKYIEQYEIKYQIVKR